MCLKNQEKEAKSFPCPKGQKSGPATKDANILHCTWTFLAEREEENITLK